MLNCLVSLVTLPLNLLSFSLSPCGFSLISACAVGLFVLRKWSDGGRCYSKARLDGKTAIVTGANSGIGKETARDFIRRGARVILACRDVEKAEMVAAEIRNSATNDGLAVVKKLDLASMKSIRAFCKDVLENEDRIDLLVNNAGIMMCPEWKTEDGFEMQIGTNHFGHFLLTNLLLDKIKKSPSARIMNVSSLLHYPGKIHFDNINLKGEYDPDESYNQSKLANVLFTRELAKRLKGTGVSTFSLHPGVIATNLSRHIMVSKPIYKYIWPLMSLLVLKNCEQGAQTSIYCSVQEGIEHLSGKYFSDCKVKEESKLGQSDVDAERLWKLSEKMTGLS